MTLYGDIDCGYNRPLFINPSFSHSLPLPLSPSLSFIPPFYPISLSHPLPSFLSPSLLSLHLSLLFTLLISHLYLLFGDYQPDLTWHLIPCPFRTRYPRVCPPCTHRSSPALLIFPLWPLRIWLRYVRTYATFDKYTWTPVYYAVDAYLMIGLFIHHNSRSCEGIIWLIDWHISQLKMT